MRRTFLSRILALLVLFTLATLHVFAADTYKIVHTYPHDSRAYTQGLIYLDGHLYESTGLNGRSSLRMVDLATGRVQQEIPIPSKYFAEGLTNWGSTLVQLTWLSHVAFVYDRFSFRQLSTLHYDGEGWGLTQDGAHIILSDGSATLRFLDPTTFRVVRRIVVKDRGAPVTQLNELEYVHGEIYANVWLPDKEHPDPEAVLNGIAYDAVHDRLFVTGKLWPRLFEIKVVPRSGPLVPVSRPKDKSESSHP
jgi:glutamine cyclotransferase